MGDCQRVLGIDLGIASCGWGVIEVRDKAGSIFAKDGKPAVGVRCFDSPLVYKTGEPKDAQRRSARGQRRVIRRRRQRMNAIRDLLHRNGMR
jgi:CRISPR-associated endonuclease Csn1